MRNVKSLPVTLNSKYVTQLEALYFENLGWVIQFCVDNTLPYHDNYFILDNFVVNGSFIFMVMQKTLVKSDYLQFRTFNRLLEFCNEMKKEDFDTYIVKSIHEHPLQKILKANNQKF